MSKVTGTIKPLHDKVFVSDMDFGAQQTNSGIYIPSSDGKADGIMPRWGKVWAIGPDQTDVGVGEWILVEHGRWTRTVEVEQEDGSILKVRMVDGDAIMMSSDEKPSETIYRRAD
jgi:co-chaperonin GroES (HSP10)